MKKRVEKPKALKRGWVVVEPWFHVGKKRVARDHDLRVEPGRKFILGQKVTIRRRRGQVLCAGFEGCVMVVHIRLEARQS
jgi:hypothetical protein